MICISIAMCILYIYTCKQVDRQGDRQKDILRTYLHIHISHFQLKLHPTSAKTYGHTYMHIHSNSYIIDIYIYICIHIPEAESLACLAPPCVTRHGACGSGWQVLKAILGFVSGEVEMILKRAGNEENHPDAFQGRGGILMVGSVAVGPRHWMRSIKRSFAIRRTGHHYLWSSEWVPPSAAFPPVMDFCVGLLGRQGSRNLRSPGRRWSHQVPYKHWLSTWAWCSWVASLRASRWPFCQETPRCTPARWLALGHHSSDYTWSLASAWRSLHARLTTIFCGTRQTTRGVEDVVAAAKPGRARRVGRDLPRTWSGIGHARHLEGIFVRRQFEAGHRHQHPTPSTALWNECLHVRWSLDFWESLWQRTRWTSLHLSIRRGQYLCHDPRSLFGGPVVAEASWWNGQPSEWCSAQLCWQPLTVFAFRRTASRTAPDTVSGPSGLPRWPFLASSWTLPMVGVVWPGCIVPRCFHKTTGPRAWPPPLMPFGLEICWSPS